jgi:hypothetical protein
MDDYMGNIANYTWNFLSCFVTAALLNPKFYLELSQSVSFAQKNDKQYVPLSPLPYMHKKKSN